MTKKTPTPEERMTAKNRAAFTLYVKKHGEPLAVIRATLKQVDEAIASGDVAKVQALARALNDFHRVARAPDGGKVANGTLAQFVRGLRSITSESQKAVEQEDEQIALDAKMAAEQRQADLEAKEARLADYKRLKALEKEFGSLDD